MSWHELVSFIIGAFLGGGAATQLYRAYLARTKLDLVPDKFGEPHIILGRGEGGIRVKTLASYKQFGEANATDVPWSQVYWIYPSLREEANVRMEEQNIRQELSS